ncbi:hypothetical protein [Dyadobacter tibetensis]|uniref:hypothetical protein n=1 Tax=Dyadobacter tibetensis TaxID=1211851 RepID=UPI0004715DA9|nr:hypothetical protein [Dyadobacter tibetensis]
MKRNTDIIKKYALFGSKLRGEAYVEKYLANLLSEMETHANLYRMGVRLQQEWVEHEEGVCLLTEAFGGKELSPTKGFLTLTSSELPGKSRPRLLRRTTKGNRRVRPFLFETD